MLHTDEPTPCNTQGPELWFSARPKDQEKAKRLCRDRCNVQFPCLEDALETERMMGQPLEGIHGGLTKTQRVFTAIKRLA